MAKHDLNFKRYEDNPQMHVRAQQAWLILVGCAMRRQSITYGDLSKLMGYRGPMPAANAVFRVHAYCKEVGLPLVNLLVVNTKTGVPEGGLPDGESIHAEVQRVYQQDWYAIRVPSTNAFRRAWEQFEA